MIRALITAVIWLAGTMAVRLTGLDVLAYNYLMLMGLVFGVVAYAIGQAVAQWLET